MFKQDQAFQRAVRLLKQAQHAVAITGAGISTPSGIPDFRSDTGLWQRYDPMEVASLWGFRLHPEKFYDWIRPLLRPLLEAQPNPAHHALARLEQAGHLQAIVTQNIDGLHQKAGSRRVYEVHGNLDHMVCLDCGWRGDLRAFLKPEFLSGQALPRCSVCGSVLKPDVVLFGENLPWHVWNEAQREVERADLVLVAGSSLEVSPVNQLPYEAYRRGKPILVVNLSPTYIDPYAQAVLRGDVAEILPALADAVLAEET